MKKKDRLQGPRETKPITSFLTNKPSVRTKVNAHDALTTSYYEEPKLLVIAGGTKDFGHNTNELC